MSSQRLTEMPSEEAAATAPRTEIDRDAAFHLLSNARRRAVMRYLVDVASSVDLGTLAEHVASIENDCTPGDLSSDDRKRVYISLYQGHMPKLADHDIVAYDQARGTVEARPLLEAFEPYLDETPLSLDDDGAEPTGPSSQSGFAAAIASVFGR